MIRHILSKYGVANFKAINKYTEIDFKPITLLIGEHNSGKSSLMNSLFSFVNFTKTERYIDIQPFYFDDNNVYLNFDSVKNDQSSPLSNIEHYFSVLQKEKSSEIALSFSKSPERYDVSLMLGIDTGRIRLKEAIIKVVFDSNIEIDLLHLKRVEKRQVLKVNMLYIVESKNARYPAFYSNIYKSKVDQLIGDLFCYDIANEVIEIGNKEYVEERRFENGIFYPKSIIGLIRSYKYYLLDLFYIKYGGEFDSIQYKCAKWIIENMFDYLNSKLTLITEAINVKHVNCKKLLPVKDFLPEKSYNNNQFKELFVEYIENKNYDVYGYNLVKQLVKQFNLAEDFSIEGDFNTGYSIYITINNTKITLADSDLSHQKLISIILMIIMNGGFNQHFKGEDKTVHYTPYYYPIIIENPEHGLTNEHQKLFPEIILSLTKSLNTQFVIETQSNIIIDRFKELSILCSIDSKDYSVYHFSKSKDGPDVIVF